MLTTVPRRHGRGPSRIPRSKRSERVDRQFRLWNRRDLEGFMQGYWRSPELTSIRAAPSSRAGSNARALPAIATRVRQRDGHLNSQYEDRAAGSERRVRARTVRFEDDERRIGRFVHANV